MERGGGGIENGDRKDRVVEGLFDFGMKNGMRVSTHPSDYRRTQLACLEGCGRIEVEVEEDGDEAEEKGGEKEKAEDKKDEDKKKMKKNEKK